jgi:hypothetical protein
MADVQNFYLAFHLLGITSESLELGMWHFVCMETDHKHTYKHFVNCMLTIITNMASVENFEVNLTNVTYVICISGNYAQNV